VRDAKVSRSTCFSCHDSFDGFPWHGSAAPYKDIHDPELAVTVHVNDPNDAVLCGQCHDGLNAPDTAADFHNGIKTERTGIIWDGEDLSVVWGKRVKIEITKVAVDPTGSSTIAVSWTASMDQDGDGTFVPVDPCNSDYAAGPVFHRSSTTSTGGTSGSSVAFSILRAYAQGDDWVANLSTTSPGQPGATVTLSTSNTSCDASNVAVTKFKKDTLPSGVSRGIIAIQGKAQMSFGAAIGTGTVRVQTPTREFNTSSNSYGNLPTVQRRQIVSMEKCLKCHSGSMYQHGGVRVDRVEVCIMCHNPASNERQNRVAWGVDENEAYDKKFGQTYDFKTMLHSIHSAGESGIPLVYYRTNGVYAFGSQAAIDALPQWKETTKVECVGLDSHGVPGTQISYEVHGSRDANSANPDVYGSVSVPVTYDPVGDTTTITPLDPTAACSVTPVKNLVGLYPQAVYKTLNEIVVHYPRGLSECDACHVNDSEKRIPDPTKSMAVTDNHAGASTNPTTGSWSNQIDDELRGPVGAACWTCHQTTVKWVQDWYTEHQQQYGFDPQVLPSTASTPGGRRDFIDGNVGEHCYRCHGAGRAADVAKAHGPKLESE
jgi:hypothetical protein